MFAAANRQLSPLDVPTLAFVAVCIAALLGLLLIFAWVQQRNMRALAWWGSAYLIGASSIALWGAPAPLFAIAAGIAAGAHFPRLWHGLERRAVVPWAATCCRWPLSPAPSCGWSCANCRCCRKAAMRASRSAPWWSRPTPSSSLSNCGASGANRFIRARPRWSCRCVHAAIFLMPLGMQVFLPRIYAAEWLAVFTLETMLYAVGTAFIVLLMVKDNDVDVYRNAASTDHLTGLLNRRAFLETALNLCARRGERGEPVTMLMLDLDHFKSINDRFGHAVGDEVLRMFAQVARSSMRAQRHRRPAWRRGVRRHRGGAHGICRPHRRAPARRVSRRPASR